VVPPRQPARAPREIGPPVVFLASGRRAKAPSPGRITRWTVAWTASWNAQPMLVSARAPRMAFDSRSLNGAEIVSLPGDVPHQAPQSSQSDPKGFGLSRRRQNFDRPAVRLTMSWLAAQARPWIRCRNSIPPTSGDESIRTPRLRISSPAQCPREGLRSPDSRCVDRRLNQERFPPMICTPNVFSLLGARRPKLERPEFQFNGDMSVPSAGPP